MRFIEREREREFSKEYLNNKESLIFRRRCRERENATKSMRDEERSRGGKRKRGKVR